MGCLFLTGAYRKAKVIGQLLSLLGLQNLITYLLFDPFREYKNKRGKLQNSNNPMRPGTISHMGLFFWTNFCLMYIFR